MSYTKLVRCKTRYSDLISDVDGNIQEKENWVDMQFDKSDIDIVTHALDIDRGIADDSICLIYLREHGSFTVDIPINDAFIMHSEKYKTA